MFFENTAPDLLTRAIVLGPIALLWINLVVRITGLRAFSKMAAFDFVVTVAIGSLLANAATASDWPAFIQAVVAMAALLAMQALIARLRRSSDAARDAVENEPRILMRDGEFLRDQMKEARIAESDIWAKLREANVLDLSEVRAVVLETTGDITVLHGSRLDPSLLNGVGHGRDGKAE